MKKVKVYRNLHKGLWSVLDPRGRVWMRVPYVWLEDVTFIVRPAGRAKVVRDKRKNVHAFVSVFLSITLPPQASELTPISYNPYRGANFVRLDTGEPILAAELVVLDSDGKAYAMLKGEHDGSLPVLL